MGKKRMSRRDFIRSGGLAGLGIALTAVGCQPKTVVVETEKIVKETVVVKEEVEKVVKETVVVEVEKQAPASTGPTPIVFWFQAENHEPEYSTRVEELNDKFNLDFTYELLSRDAMNKKFPATLMSGTGFPDIIEMNADDVVLYLKGDDNVIPFLSLNEVLNTSPYYEAVLESRWDRFTKDGQRYAAPHDIHPLVLLYHDRAWKELGVDLTEVVTWDDYLAACEKVPKEMEDGRPRYAVMDCLSCTNLPARMMEKGLWWTDAATEPMLTDPRFRESVADWMRFKDYRVEIDWGNQVAMVKEGQVLTQLCPDWLYGIHKQGTAEDAEFLSDSPMRVMRIPDFVADGRHTGTWGGTGCSVPKQTLNRDLSVEVMLYLYFDNTDNILEKRYKDTGILPPVPGAWESAGFHEQEAYTGGQVAAEVFIASAQDMPGIFENWKTHFVSGAWGEQFSLIWEGELDLDEGIKIADENARSDIEANA
jgi:arabinosaccharide transport system substrate-binding protein